MQKSYPLRAQRIEHRIRRPRYMFSLCHLLITLYFLRTVPACAIELKYLLMLFSFNHKTIPNWTNDMVTWLTFDLEEPFKISQRWFPQLQKWGSNWNNIHKRDLQATKAIKHYILVRHHHHYRNFFSIKYQIRYAKRMKEGKNSYTSKAVRKIPM